MQTERTTIPTAKIALNIGQIPDVPQNPRFIRDERFEALKKSITDDPEMLSLRELIVYPLAKNDGEKTFVVIGGNMRFRACRELGYTEIPCVILPEETPPEKLRAVLIKDNISHGELDWEILHRDFDESELVNLGLEMAKTIDGDEELEDLDPEIAPTFLVPPFSVFNTQDSTWQKRKSEWKKRTDAIDETIAKSGVAVFDATLCETVLKFFSGRGASVLDPFSSGETLGAVACLLGRKFDGVSVRKDGTKTDDWKNVSTQDAYGEEIHPPVWHIGNPENMDKIFSSDKKFDLVFSCVPTVGGVKYDDDSGDFSLSEHTKFLATFREVAKHCFTRLEDDAFCAMLVGDFRDNKGILRNFVSDTIGAFTDAGFKLYNEIILVTPIAAAALRAQRIFGSTRKTVKTHQNLLVFLKGDARKATAKCEHIDEAEMEKLVDETTVVERLTNEEY